MATSTLAFSRGASKASCHEMVPGHIRAQPQDPQHSHVTLRTSASSYLPGQLVTVTVRSSRDFMGFLLQARSVEGAEFRADVRQKVGVRFTRLGQVLDGGSWALTPPGTHVLRCFSEGDTLTHSDKQLKRNLSFVWKAPDAPIGDVKFYITVVQSYFVYWAGIESTVVRDGSRSPWNGSSITGMDRGNLNFAQQEEEATSLLALQVHGTSNNQTNETTSPATTLWPPTLPSSGRPNDKSQETPTEATQPVLGRNIPVTLASLRVDLLTYPEITENNIALTSASLQNASKDSETDIYASSGSLSRVTEKAAKSSSSDIGSLPSSISSSSPMSTSPSFSTLTTSLSTASFLGFPSSSNSSAAPSSLASAQTTTPHPEPSPAPRRSLYNTLTSTSTPVPSQHLTLGHKLRIQNHISSSYSEPNLNQPTPRTVVHLNPEPHPNQDPNIKQNFGRKLKPNIPKTDTKPKVPLNPSITPGEEGKYPDIIPRHTAWELGMLLGCSAGLGMVLVVGVRYIYRQACGKRTEVSFNDREREYGRGERGLIHVQECGDLVRVRRIRDNSFVLLAEYDLLASPGD
ncbi:uncharacterized protein reeld1 [Tautogolabrus adspersus]